MRSRRSPSTGKNLTDPELRRHLRAKILASSATAPGSFVQPRHVSARVRSREGPDAWLAGRADESRGLLRALSEVLEESVGGPMQSELRPEAGALIALMKRRPSFDTLVRIARSVRWRPVG